MQIAVLGTGSVGRTLAGRLAELGHSITVGTRDPADTLARTSPDAMGGPPFAGWAADHPDVGLATFADAATGADLVVLATSGAAAPEVLEQTGADRLAGTVVVDVTNPLDFSAGMPPTLFVKDTDSLAERLQRACPEARIVKTLNTLTAELMIGPAALPAGSTVFLSGNDAGAKATVADLLRSFGHTDVLDLGDLSTARGTEMVLPLWLRVMGALGTPMFNFAVVR